MKKEKIKLSPAENAERFKILQEKVTQGETLKFKEQNVLTIIKKKIKAGKLKF